MRSSRTDLVNPAPERNCDLQESVLLQVARCQRSKRSWKNEDQNTTENYISTGKLNQSCDRENISSEQCSETVFFRNQVPLGADGSEDSKPRMMVPETSWRTEATSVHEVNPETELATIARGPENPKWDSLPWLKRYRTLLLFNAT